MNNLNLLLLWLASFIFATTVFAQPAFYFDPDTAYVQTNDQTCVELRALDFDHIQKFNFSINWDANVITGLEYTTDSAFDNAVIEINIQEGYLTFEWAIDNDPGCPAVETQLTLPDEAPLMELCFNGLPDCTNLSMSNDPVQLYITRSNACPLNISMFLEDGYLCTGSLSTETPEKLQELFAFPNPSSGELTFSLPDAMQNLLLRITDARGRLLMTTEVHRKTHIYLNEKGLYFLTFYDEQGLLKTQKLLVK